VLDGKRIRVKVSAKTKAEAQAKLKAKLDEQRQGVRSSGTYTVRDCVEDWIAHGLDGRSDETRQTYREAVAPLLAILGSRTLRDLTATDVRLALVSTANTRSTRRAGGATGPQWSARRSTAGLPSGSASPLPRRAHRRHRIR